MEPMMHIQFTFPLRKGNDVMLLYFFRRIKASACTMVKVMVDQGGCKCSTRTLHPTKLTNMIQQWVAEHFHYHTIHLNVCSLLAFLLWVFWSSISEVIKRETNKWFPQYTKDSLNSIMDMMANMNKKYLFQNFSLKSTSDLTSFA